MDLKKLRLAGEMILEAIGEDPTRDGLAGTPDRFARWWAEFAGYDPGNTDVTFESVETDQMVAVTGMRVYSVCEHHLLPFIADVSIGYITEGKVLGLSKFARIAQQYAHRLQVQERLVNDIADEVKRVTSSASVAVVARGIHLCMAMRGVRMTGVMTSSSLSGLFRHDPSARAEFLALCSGGTLTLGTPAAG